MSLENGLVMAGNPSPPRIPIIDFLRWEEGSAQERFEIGAALVEACHEVGFVCIINHGVSQKGINEAFEWSQRLFNLSLEEKMLAPHPPGPTVHRGYSHPVGDIQVPHAEFLS